MAKISVVIPVYNVEKYIKQCLDSVVNQTEKDIEIIIVEDCSSDGSMGIVQEYEKKDSRIKVIQHAENKGLFQARKDGVLLASGEYLMHLDSDDYLEENACEKLYELISSENVDLIQFGSYLEPENNVSEEMVEWVEKFMEPAEKMIDKTNLESACFIDGDLNCNLVNKIWKTEISKKAYSLINDGRYISGEDRLATFIILFHSDSAYGTKEKFYHYRLGVGVTGGKELDLDRFANRCQGARVVEYIDNFLRENDKDNLLKEEKKFFEQAVLWDCVDSWYKKLDDAGKKQGFDLLIKNWGATKVISALATLFFENQKDIREKSLEKKNVAIYYRYLGYEMMDEVIKRYIEHGGNVTVLITDGNAPMQGNTYDGYPVEKIRCADESNWGDYELRAQQLREVLCKNKIDKVIYLSPTSHLLYLDSLLFEGAGVDTFVANDEYSIDVINKEREERKREREKSLAIRMKTKFSGRLSKVKGHK